MQMTQASLPGPYQAPPPPQQQLKPAASGSGIKINVLKSLKIHKVTAILVALVTLGLGLAVILRHHDIYSATSILYVSPNPHTTLTEDREQEYPYETYIQQQVHAVTRYDVMAAALHKLPQGTWQHKDESEQSAIERMQKALEISRIGMTYQVEISLQGLRPTHLAEIVNTVTDTFIEKAKNEEFYGRDERLQTLRDERAHVQADLDARLQEQANITTALGVAQVGAAGSADSYDDQIQKLRSDYTTAHEQRIQAEAKLSSLQSGNAAALNAAADESIATDPQLSALKTSLASKRTQLLDQLAGLTPNNPVRKQTQEQLDQTEAALQQMQNDQRRKAATRIEQQLRAEVNRTATIESKIQSDLQHQTKTATGAAPKFQRADALKGEIDYLQKRFASVDERIRDLELESSSPGSVHLFQPARTPLNPEPSKAGKLMVLLLPISIIMGIAAAVLFDLLDPFVHTSSDMDSVLGFAPMGILFDDGEVTQLVSDECALRLAAGIDHAAHAAGVRTFIITGVNAGAGTTSIIERLGSMLAKLGRKTLTIDGSGDTEPIAYTTIGVNPLKDNCTDLTVTEPIAPGTHASLPASTAVVTQPLPSKANLLTSFVASAFKDLTNDYDIVLIDAMPILSSAETEYLARFADVTILLAEAGRTKKSELKRAARLLERLNVSGVAAILNKVVMLRVDNALKQDLREFEARMSKSNLRWKPRADHNRPSSAPPFSSEQNTTEEEFVSFARKL